MSDARKDYSEDLAAARLRHLVSRLGGTEGKMRATAEGRKPDDKRA
jgi:hypothetical protein